MQSFEDVFNTTEPSEGPTFRMVPEGEYKAQVVDASIDMTKDTPQVKWTWEVVDGEEKGNQIKVTNFLNSTKANGEPSPAIGIFKGQLKKFGFEHIGFDQIAGVLEKLIGKQADIYVSHYTTQKGKTYANVSVNEVMGQSSNSGESSEPSFDSNEKIPF